MRLKKNLMMCVDPEHLCGAWGKGVGGVQGGEEENGRPQDFNN